MAFYSDRLSVFHVQARDRAQGGPGLSQFGRALRDLNIDSLCAKSPQAKGRVERANGTLQDRLVKEMRLAKISHIEQANTWLQQSGFFHKLSEQFSVSPSDATDSHRPVVVDLA